MDVPNCVDGERRAWAVDVDSAHPEAGIRRRREDGHEVAVLGGTHLTIGLLPRLSGRHKNDLGQPESRGDLTRCHEVAVVDRIERSPHDPEPARMRGCRHVWRSYGRPRTKSVLRKRGAGPQA